MPGTVGVDRRNAVLSTRGAVRGWIRGAGRYFRCVRPASSIAGRGRPPQRGIVDPWSRSTGMKNTCPSLGGIGILYYLYASSTRQSGVSAENLTIQGQDGEEREERGLFPGREITSFFTIFSFLIIRTCSQPLRNNMVTANRPGTPHRRDRSTTRRPPRTLLPRGRP